MHGAHSPVDQAIAIQFEPLFAASWSYDDFYRLMPFGQSTEGQAYAYSTTGEIAGETLHGSLEIAQYPRIRADGLLLPDMHGLIRLEVGEQIIVRAAGFGIPDAEEPGTWRISHWMRLWTAAPELAWLNNALAFGIGTFTDEVARFRYFVARPSVEPVAQPEAAPAVELLGTARWEYPVYESVRPFGDVGGVGIAGSTGTVADGPLAGSWRGWHYPSYRRDGLYQIDAHAEIGTPTGAVLLRHGGVATRPPEPQDGLLYDVVQYATFATEVPGLARLNSTLAVGVGHVRAPGIVTVSYYGLS